VLIWPDGHKGGAHAGVAGDVLTTSWMRVVSMASARVIGGRMVVSRHTRILVKSLCYRDRRNFTFCLIA
jgi:hypothetical protein